MNKKTREALEASIAKWERVTVASTPDDVSLGIDSCPLCALFYEGGTCDGCPVSKRTGRPSCRGTPYEDVIKRNRGWWYAIENKYSSAPVDKEEFHAAARAEVEFLKSLRDPE